MLRKSRRSRGVEPGHYLFDLPSSVAVGTELHQACLQPGFRYLHRFIDQLPLQPVCSHSLIQDETHEASVRKAGDVPAPEAMDTSLTSASGFGWQPLRRW